MKKNKLLGLAPCIYCSKQRRLLVAVWLIQGCIASLLVQGQSVVALQGRENRFDWFDDGIVMEQQLPMHYPYVSNGNFRLIGCDRKPVSAYTYAYQQGTNGLIADGTLLLFVASRLNDCGDKYLWGLLNQQGLEVVPCEYDTIQCSKEGFFFAQKGDKYDVLLKGGKKIGETTPHDSLVYKADNGYTYTIKGAVATCPELDRKKGIRKVITNNLYGIVDADGKEIVYPIYDDIKFSPNGFFAVKKNNYWGLLDENGKEILQLAYEDINYNYAQQSQELWSGRAAIKKNSLTGMISPQGKVIVPPEYDIVGDYGDYLMAVKNDQMMFFTKQGKSIKIDKKYNIKGTTDGYFVYEVTHETIRQYGLLDINGKEVTPARYSAVSQFDNQGVAKVAVYQVLPSKPLYGYLDRNGKETVLPIYTQLGTYSCGKAFYTKEDGEFGFIDKMGKEVVSVKPADTILYKLIMRNTLHERTSGESSVANGKKQGKKVALINDDGELLAAAKYDAIYPFSDGYTQVILNHKIGYVNNKGIETVAPMYDEGSAVRNGVAIVRQGALKWLLDVASNKLWFATNYEAYEPLPNHSFIAIASPQAFGIVDSTGKTIVPMSKSISELREGMLTIQDNNQQYRYYDANKQLLLPESYQNAGNFCHGLAKVSQNDKWFYIDVNGKWIKDVE